MALGIVVLDVSEFRGVLESWDIPVEVAKPLVDVRVARSDISNIALEVLDIDDLRTISIIIAID